MSLRKILLLGGTADAKAMATRLHFAGLQVIYSIAGLVRQPDLPCQVISGGFRQYGGLSAYLKRESISEVLDVTHPYAANMSRQASESVTELGIAYCRFTRPAWVKQEGDQWHQFETWPELINALEDKKSVMLTAGQIDQKDIDLFGRFKGQKQYLRTAITPLSELPSSMSWIKGIGPFSKEREKAQFIKYGIDALVTKNSGGEATFAKIDVAREHGVPVFFLKRPELPSIQYEFSDLDKCFQFILSNKKD